MGTQRVTRRLAAILAADVVGYSRLVGDDEEGTLARLKAFRKELIDPSVARDGGRVVKTMGDGLLIEFPSVVDAVRNAVDVQTAMAERNADVPEDRRMEFRVGVNLGDIVMEGDDILGDGVNIAARMEALADPGGICLSRAAFDQVEGKLDLEFENMGEHSVKNIKKPVQVYRVKMDRGGPSAEVSLPRRGQTRSQTDKPSIAVLPFDNISGDPEQNYFSDGITEDVITALSRIRWFFVIARNTTFTFKGRPVDVQTIAKDLSVDYVLEGSVRKAGNQVRITVQLIDGTTGNHLWAERYDRSLVDIFALQDEITENVVGAIEPEIAQAELDRRKSKNPENLDAWDAYLRGRSLVQLDTQDSVAEGLRKLQAAIEIDPDFARAHAMMATAYGRQLVFGFAEDRERTRDLSLQAGLRAVKLDKNDADSHVGLAMGLRATGDFEEAISELETAIEINPSHAYAHSTLGGLLGARGFSDEAIEHHRTALRLSPRDPDFATFLGRFANSCVHARRYEEAVELGRRAIRQSGGNPWIVFAETATALAHLGRIEEAREIIDRMKKFRPDATVDTVRNALIFMTSENEEHYLTGLRLAGLPEK